MAVPIEDSLIAAVGGATLGPPPALVSFGGHVIAVLALLAAFVALVAALAVAAVVREIGEASATCATEVCVEVSETETLQEVSSTESATAFTNAVVESESRGLTTTTEINSCQRVGAASVEVPAAAVGTPHEKERLEAAAAAADEAKQLSCARSENARLREASQALCLRLAESRVSLERVRASTVERGVKLAKARARLQRLRTMEATGAPRARALLAQARAERFRQREPGLSPARNTVPSDAGVGFTAKDGDFNKVNCEGKPAVPSTRHSPLIFRSIVRDTCPSAAPNEPKGPVAPPQPSVSDVDIDADEFDDFIPSENVDMTSLLTPAFSGLTQLSGFVNIGPANSTGRDSAAASVDGTSIHSSLQHQPPKVAAHASISTKHGPHRELRTDTAKGARQQKLTSDPESTHASSEGGIGAWDSGFLQRLLRVRDDELVQIKRLSEMARVETLNLEAEAGRGADIIKRGHGCLDELRSQVLSARSDLGHLGHHTRQLEDEDLSRRVQRESLCKQEASLKEQLQAVLGEVARLRASLSDKEPLQEERMEALAAELQEARAHAEEVQSLFRQSSQSITSLQADLNTKDSNLSRCKKRMVELDSEDGVIRRVAELFAKSTANDDVPAEKRRAAQRRLLVSLHPDKCPATRIATRLTQEMQRTRWWVR
eukprot:TRINITY_DN57051_c0_g1_i1.p1 TRINITY_DN57051_c0_g1~~TRINITY_DN57051_c0_g1_i1.p1  ORF type:complete len:662 (+),score=115.84 TRINITY_DN57051_c0_g1_i1:61-2046(+)